MRLKLTTLAIASCLLSAHAQENNSLYSLTPQANKQVENLHIDQNHEVPNFIRFKKNQGPKLNEGIRWIKENLCKNPAFNFVLMNSDTDDLGFTHFRYQQTYNGIPIEGTMFLIHAENGTIVSMNGDIFAGDHFSGAKTMAEETALQKAMDSFNSESFKWEIESEEAFIKEKTGNPNATYKPKAELVYVAQNGDFTGKKFRLAYKFDIYAHRPIARAWTFIDAATGKVLFKNKRIYEADTPGTATTAYSGTQNIISDSFGGGYRLRENGRGNGINTYDMQNGTNYGNAQDITSPNPNWVMAGNNQYALDAHWGAEMTYDYYNIEHNRNSIDDNGFALNSYVHYDNNYANAFWNGSEMTYGDGNGTITALTSLDIAGHEITHGLTTFTANLVYQDESGALNESFSDIFGVAVEFFALGQANGDWLMGEDIGSVIRSVSNPNAYGDPDTYFGNGWAPLGGADNGGVHTNSGVQNYWFYLLSEGGSGTNDAGDVYNVTGIGLQDAAAIAFRNLTVYLGPNSNYIDARFYAIQAATDLFGPCSPQVISTTNAWYAVNVGDEYDAVFQTDMVANLTSGCVSPFNVDFSAVSASAGTGTYSWDFGDGNTASGLNVSHTYSTPGTYTVTLIEDGGVCGIDTAINVDFISAGQLALPNVTNGSICTPGAVDLFASSAGNLTWWDAPTGGNQVNTGTSYSPTISTTTSYWVEAETGLTPDYVGPVDNTFGNGGYFTGNQALVFDALQPFTLVSVWVDANGAGNRTIELRDNTGALMQSTTVNVPNGGSRINLNFSVPQGTDFELTSPSPDLYRNSDGAAYPYTLANVCSITGSTAGAAGYYYFFYDWEIQTAPCQSGRVEVIGAIAEDPIAANDSICGTGIATVNATGSGVGTLHWYDDPAGTNQVGTGGSYTTPTISTNTTYYVAEELPGDLNNVGPVDNSIGSGAYFNNDQHLLFDVFSNCTLESVLVYAGSTGSRTIELRDAGGTVLQDTVMNITAGPQRIYLNFDLVPGTDYQLGCAAGSNPNLWRNDAGPTYPYTLAGKVSITESSAGVAGYYYFFYDWEIRDPSCITNLVSVDAIVNTQMDATIDPVTAFCPTDAAVNLTAVDGGGTWSGTGITNGTTGEFDPSVAGNGIHEIIYDITGTCGDTDTISISVNSALDATITAPTNMCSLDPSLNLNSADVGGTWSGTGVTNTSSGTFDPVTAGVGTHEIIYAISGACGDADTVNITIDLQQDASINPAGPYCINDPVVNLTSVEPGGTWSGNGITNSTTGEFDPAVAMGGSHTISYVLTGICPDSSAISFNVFNIPNVNLSVTNDTVCLSSSPVTLNGSGVGTGAYSGPGVTGNLFDPSSAGVGTHTLYYEVTNFNGCTGIDSVEVRVEDCVGVNEELNHVLNIFPNPSDGQFNIVMKGSAAYASQLEIMDAAGRLVYTKNIPARFGRITIATPNLSTGMYTLRISNVKHVEEHQLIVR